MLSKVSFKLSISISMCVSLLFLERMLNIEILHGADGEAIAVQSGPLRFDVRVNLLLHGAPMIARSSREDLTGHEVP